MELAEGHEFLVVVLAAVEAFRLVVGLLLVVLGGLASRCWHRLGQQRLVAQQDQGRLCEPLLVTGVLLSWIRPGQAGFKLLVYLLFVSCLGQVPVVELLGAGAL